MSEESVRCWQCVCVCVCVRVCVHACMRAGSVCWSLGHTLHQEFVTLLLPSIPQALLECVRLRTFGKYGLQQMQVDAHYLQIYLWRFVSDEQ